MLGAKQLRMAGTFLRYRFREIHVFEVQALLTTSCNLRCRYCRCPSLNTPEMTTEQWVGLIRHFAGLGTQRIKFQGGEPTLRKDFGALCRAAREAGITAAVVTNGLRIAAEPELLDDLDEVVVSIDSVTPGFHDDLRGRGSHARAVRAVELARARGMATYVNMVVSTDTLGEVPAMLEFCEARGVRLNPQPIAFGREAFDRDAARLALSNEQNRVLHRQLVRWKREGRALMFSPAAYQVAVDWPDNAELTRRCAGESDCMAGRFYVHVEANGDVWPCSMHGADFVAKNLLGDGVEAALRQARHHNCADCFYAYLCERKLLFRLNPAALLELLRRS